MLRVAVVLTLVLSVVAGTRSQSVPKELRGLFGRKILKLDDAKPD
jgi:hypothetical protein